jgi:hypothetical protein
MSDLQTLQQQIAALQEQISSLKASNKVKRAKPEKVAKLYAGLNGHYFTLPKSDDPAYVEAQGKIQQIRDDKDIMEKLERSQLGRAIVSHYNATGTMVFWAPNQETLMFGPVMAGIKNAKDFEIFTIPASLLTDLGHGFDAEKKGRIELDALIKFNDFIQMEKDLAEKLKLEKELAKISASTKS